MSVSLLVSRPAYRCRLVCAIKFVPLSISMLAPVAVSVIDVRGFVGISVGIGVGVQVQVSVTEGWLDIYRCQTRFRCVSPGIALQYSRLPSWLPSRGGTHQRCGGGAAGGGRGGSAGEGRLLPTDGGRGGQSDHSAPSGRCGAAAAVTSRHHGDRVRPSVRRPASQRCRQHTERSHVNIHT